MTHFFHLTFLLLLLQDNEFVRAYIPSDVWYEFPSGIKYPTIGTYVNFSTPLSKINVHLRGGFILPMKIPGDNLILGRDNPFTLLVAQSHWNTANGSLFWDDGDSLDSNAYNYLTFSSTENELTIDAMVRNYKTSAMRLEMIKILGVDQSINQVLINGQSYSKFLYNSLDQVNSSIEIPPHYFRSFRSCSSTV